MAIPLIVLAIGSVLAGYVGVPHALGGSNRIETFLEPSFHPAAHASATAGAHGGVSDQDHVTPAPAEAHAAPRQRPRRPRGMARRRVSITPIRRRKASNSR